MKKDIVDFSNMRLGGVDLDLLSALAAPKEKVKVTSYMGNKYFMLDFIWQHSPQEAESVLDAFSGGANTAYFFKQKGLAVTANDKLRYPYHIARAIIENSSETLSDEEIEMLLKPNSEAGNFIADTFSGYFYTRQILQFLDNTWWNIQKLSGYKRDLALFALGYTCVMKARFGEFSRTKKTMQGKLADESKQDTSLGNIPLSEFKEAFVKNLRKVNSLVFDSGESCEALNIDALEAIEETDADFIYADPPYITQFGSNDYGAKLHFVEGLMTYWKDKELRDNARKDFESEVKYNRESMCDLFNAMISRAQVPLLISYRDKAYPTEEEIRAMLKARYEKVVVKGVEVEYGIAKWGAEDGGKHAKELLFIGSGSLKTAIADEKHELPIYEEGIDDSLSARLIATNNFVGSPRNKYGTHSSIGFKGGLEKYKQAWRIHFSQVNGGDLTPKAAGPIRGTVRRTEMIAAALKASCNLPSTDAIGPRGGGESPLPGDFPQKPSDYGLSRWANPSDDDLKREDITFTCKDLQLIKRAALGEVKWRIRERERKEKEKEKTQSSFADRIAWLISAELEFTDIALHAKGEKYITNYIGSKQKLIDWIWENTPEGINNVFDAFSGSAVVAYMYKNHEKAVQTNDRLNYCHHIARAIIENNDEILAEEEIEDLLEVNVADGFVKQTFGGTYFSDGVHEIVDSIRANIEKLEGYKKDIALFALGKTCISRKGGFGHFGTTSPNYDGGLDTPEIFTERFRNTCRKINELIFNNGATCKAHHGDIAKIAPEVETDLVYFDPPYATQFSTTNYEKVYHFVEGLMINWKDKRINPRSKTKSYFVEHQGVTKANAEQFFRDFLEAAAHIPFWLISYRDKSFPSSEGIERIIDEMGKKSKLESKEHQYQLSAKRGEASLAQEYLFICIPAKQDYLKKAASPYDNILIMRTFANIADLQAMAPGWDETENEWRFRIREPGDFKESSFRTKEFEGIEGVYIVIGRLKPSKVPEGRDKDSAFVQSIRFKKDDWTFDDAKEWYAKHRTSFAEKRSLKKMALSAHEKENFRLLAARAAWEEAETEYRYNFRPREEFDDWSLRAILIEGAPGAFIYVGRLMPENVPPGYEADFDFIQAFRFKKHSWTQEEAEAWWEQHKSGFEPQEQKTAANYPVGNFSTRLYGTAILTAQAVESGDKTFDFILAHVGTNGNGDHFTIEELRAAAETAVGKKIDFQHDQTLKDIVGSITDAAFIEDGDKSRVEGKGDLFTGESINAKLAYKLMTRGVISHVSMECDYEEGECSVCGKRIKSKAEYCMHLKKYKGRELKGKFVYEILHGIVFTGLGLLDRKGADVGARITQVADNTQIEGDEGMKDPKKVGQEEDDQTRIAELEAENSELKEKLEALQKELDEMKAAQETAAKRERSEKLIAKWEERGRKFETDAERIAEVEKLAGYSDEAFAAVEAVVDNTPIIATQADEPPVADAGDPPASDPPTGDPPAANAADKTGKPKADAGKKPVAVDDSQSSLEDELAGGIAAFSKSRRVGAGGE